MTSEVKKWSPQQQAIYDWAESKRGSAVVIAVAGAGKTTTIVELANRIPAHLSCAFVAFNKSVATELSTRLPKHVRAMTLNGLGFSTWMRHIGREIKIEVDGKKTWKIMQRILTGAELETYASTLPKLVSMGKGAGIVPSCTVGAQPKLISLTRDTDEVWQGLIEHYQIDTDNELEAIDLARKVLVETILYGQQVVDFDDQLYLPIIHGARFWQNDWLFVDEAQDVNKIQRAMLKRALKPLGRLVAVGDPRQAIYGFRGADTSSIDKIKREFGAIELPLTVSYRCPQAVVAEAQKFVSHIQATETAPLGLVSHLPKYKAQDFLPTDAILCRNSAPIVDMAFSLIRSNVPCRVLGKEIGVGLINLIKKMKARGIESLIEKLGAYRERETAKFIAKGQEEKADALTDKIDTILVIINNLPETERTVPGLVFKIDSIFTENDKGLLTLCTVHKSKGLEWPRVFILDASKYMPSPWARQAWQQEQEANLQYVAVTRAKLELYYIETQGMAS
jgi:DNA helicase-2/ATP-dependent DNA helicase PcrA